MPALAHLGTGFAAKKFAPQIPLWVLLLSSMFLDLLSFIFLNTLWVTHGLFMAIIWTFVSLLITFIITKYLNSKETSNKEVKNKLNVIHTCVVIGFLVFGHWLLDLIGWPMTVINPDLGGVPLLFDDTQNIGLGVYSTWAGALIMDIGVFLVGIFIYIPTRKNRKN
jgi:hypothetical protein